MPELRGRAEQMELDNAETVEGDLRRARRNATRCSLWRRVRRGEQGRRRGGVRGAPAGRRGDDGGVDTEHRRQRPAGVPEDRGPAGGDPGAGAGDGGPAAKGAEEAPTLPIRRAALGDAGGDAGPGGAPGAAPGGAERGEDGRRILPGAGDGAEEGALARPREAVEHPAVGEEHHPHRIQGEGADERETGRRFLPHEGRGPVLDEGADPLGTAVEGAGVAGEEASQAARQRALPRPDVPHYPPLRFS
jgi:hypothetical protein